VAGINRNGWPLSVGIGGRFASESAVDVPVGIDVAEEHSGNFGVELEQNYPNPFNPTTTISFRLTEAQRVYLSVYDVRGRLVETLVNEWRSAGPHNVTWNAYGVGSGVYFYKISAGGLSVVKKCVVLK